MSWLSAEMSSPITIRHILIVASLVSIVISIIGWHEDIKTSLRDSDCAVQRCSCESLPEATSTSIRKTSPGNNVLGTVRTNDMDKFTAKGTTYLDKTSRTHYFECVATKGARQYREKLAHKVCNTERTFLDRQSPIVALVSFQGSGNTWTRYLLEQASGIFTGSIYCDTTLKAMFPGEYIVSPNVLAVKTHQADTISLPPEIARALNKRHFDKAVVLVRDPYDALVSEANRRWNSHTNTEKHLGLASENVFIGNPTWDWYVEYKGMSWLVLLNTWIKQTALPVLVVRYETLVTNTTQQLARMLDFLDVPIDKEHLKCLEENSEGYFKRHDHLNFDPYTRENKKAINRIIEQGAHEFGIHYKKR